MSKTEEKYFELHEPKLTVSGLCSIHIYAIATLVLFLIIGSSCSSSKSVVYNQPKTTHAVVKHDLPSTVAHLQKKVRKHRNRIAQLTLQYENCLSPAKDWTRRSRHWWERPTGHWPFQFLQ